jgi:hypothetical protein
VVKGRMEWISVSPALRSAIKLEEVLAMSHSTLRTINEQTRVTR